MQQSFKDMAQRQVNAEKSFVECVMNGADDLTEADALNILAYYSEQKLVKYDAGVGRYTVKHGGLWEARVLRDAAILAVAK